MFRHVFSAILICAVASFTTASFAADKKLTKEERKREAQLKKLRTLKDDEFYVVGRIELVPKLASDEQKLRTGGSGRLANKVFVYFSNQFVDITEESFGILKHIAEAPLEEEFVIKRKRTDVLYYSGANIMMETSASYSGYMNQNRTLHTDHLRLPGNLTYKVPAGAKAVYVGTIRYYRDKWNGITKVSLGGDLAKGKAAFKKIIQNPAIELKAVTPVKKKA